MGSHSFQLIEEIDVVEGLTDFDILDTHVGDEPRVDDVYDLSQCDDEVRTPRENEGYENFDNDSQPIDGKTFNTLEAAYDFYNRYALLNGFGTRKHNAHKIRATGAIFRRQFVCNKEGFKKVDDKRPNVNEKRRRDLRTGCEAMMQVTLSKMLGVWVVDKFQDVHNHPLTTTPSKVIKHRSHSKYHRTNVCKSLVSDLNHEGLKASQITRVVNVMKPSEEADISIRDLAAPIKTKGHPKVATRLKYSNELAKEEKKQRTCAYCHGKGHYRTGCAKRKVCKFRAGSIFPFLMNMKLFRRFDVAIHMFLRFNCNSLKAKTPIISSESGLDMHNYIKPEIDAVSQKAYLLASNVIALIEAMDCKSSGSANSFATSRIAASLASTPRSSTIILYKVSPNGL
ncbi:hypothetical protein RJ640_012463 [Escallonia rubra]|uniref:FAR1 domain-containing protein n=1 Tax=Escallonia rubra TaxID=112253 RepID=A0AA88QU59_9ASTE|nr:hypothetical protein RJ640_012463 [Escallonia rubra]